MKISSTAVVKLNQKSKSARPAHLRDAQPLVVVAVEAKLHLLSFVSVEVERLVSKSFPAGLDLALVFPVIVGFVYVKFPGPLIPLVERDLHLDNVLRLLEGVRDTASISLARPARVCLATAVPGVFGLATLRVTAAIIGITLVVPIGVHVNPRSLACIDKGWDGWQSATEMFVNKSTVIGQSCHRLHNCSVINVLLGWNQSNAFLHRGMVLFVTD